uniref:Uncharacterized protein n=1 Tax=Strigamia maritima TaxID=126957 RepID=T1JMA1_STRMM
MSTKERSGVELGEKSVKLNKEKDCFNVAGLWNKGPTFWCYLEEFDIVVLLETWVEGKDKERARKRLSDVFEWNFLAAKREKKRGRARGGHLVGIRRNIGLKCTFEDWRCGIIIKSTRAGEQGIIITAL